MDRDLNKVIIIGTDHHNVLGTVRCFGVNGIKPYGIIVKNDDSPLWVTKSRYWRQTIVIGDDSEIYDALVKNFGNETKKPVVICCSDGAMCFIDRNLNRLRDRFILPSLNGEQGAITRLMNKESQQEFLEQQGIHMLESRIIDLTAESSCHDLDYPVILKPVASIEGDKKDIAICADREEFKAACARLIELDYQRVLEQHYVSELTEYLVTGSVGPGNVSFSICRNIRQWPNNTGSGSYSQLIKDGQMFPFAVSVLRRLQSLGFRGPIDIELFEIDNAFYVNEINWRSSGRVFVNLADKRYSTLYYYLDILCMERPVDRRSEKPFFVMNEGADIRNALISRTVPVAAWLFQFLTAKSYALWYWRDLRPTFARYWYYFKKFMTG